jgi:N utilization substance protein A
MVNELKTAFDEIADMRALPRDVVLDALQSALVSAYRRDSGASSAQHIEARIDPGTGRARIFVEKEVAEDVFSENTEVTLEEARFYNPEAQLGDTVMVQVKHHTKKFGRIAAQTAKQVILQKIREAERNALFDEFVGREGDLAIGTVQSMNSSVVTLRLGERAEAILPRTQQIPGERYRQHEKLRVYIMEVKKSSKGPQIVCSRSHRNMLRRLLEYEVPEISNGQVEIKSIAREAGYRSKVAVVALQDGIDPVGACVGMRGIRIQNIVKELHDEKIDVIEWNNDAETFISKALSPARVTGVYLDDDIFGGRTAIVVVPDDQLSLAIGREGQNARLAAKLTGWRIDIKSVTETVAGALENLDVPPLDLLVRTHAQLIDDVRAILAKRSANKAVMPEEYTLLGKFADLVEKRVQRMRDDIRKSERAQIAAVRATLPQVMFTLPIARLDLGEDMTEALGQFGNVGEIMLAALADEKRLEKALNEISRDAMSLVQAALDRLMEGEVEFEPVEMVEPVPVQETVVVPEAVAPPDEVVERVPEVVEESEVLIDAFGGIIAPEAEAIQSEVEIDYDSFDVVDDDSDDDYEENSRKKKDKKDRRKRRRLVFDEESGEVVAKRQRKRGQNEWGGDLD